MRKNHTTQDQLHIIESMTWRDLDSSSQPNRKDILKFSAANDFLRTDEDLSGSHNLAKADSPMPQTTQRYDLPQSMLKSIAEATTLCYYAQCHYKQASNLAAAWPYHHGKYVDSRHNPLLEALRESRLGSEKLQKSFTFVRKNLVLAENFPVLVAHAGWISIAKLQELDTRSTALFPAHVSTTSEQQPKKREQELIMHCGSILQFVNPCEEIATHQQKLLEAVKGQILAENPSLVPVGHREDHWKSYFCPNSHYGYNHQFYQHQHAMTGQPKIPVRTDDITIPNKIAPKPNTQQEEQHFVTKGTSARWNAQQYQYDSRKSPVAHTKRRASISKSVDDDEFEPLSIDEGIDLSMELNDLSATTNIASSIAQALGPIITDEIFPGSKFKLNFPEDTVKVSDGINTTTTTKRSATKTPATLPPPLSTAMERKQKSRSARRVRSTGSQPKHRHQRPPRRQKKKKTVEESYFPSSEKSNESSLLAFALGGRMDFLKKDAVLGKGGTTGGLGIGSSSSDSDGEFLFDNQPMSRRSYSY